MPWPSGFGGMAEGNYTVREEAMYALCNISITKVALFQALDSLTHSMVYKPDFTERSIRAR
jgi:hypothetical protein